ncbi:MAG: carboxymuconolactone decarboxylase family protein [Anaerolineales bacterium]|nr:carboxymuconolactone decarboxylase family protein [Anaerolineales bacterium]
MNSVFSKRIYTIPLLFQDINHFSENIEYMRYARKSQKISKAFAEKIMLVVTGVNGCRYCSYGHSQAALAEGVPEDELKKLLEGEIGDFPEHEAVALLFAQHYAESHGHPEPTAYQRLLSYYGEETTKSIMAYLRMITFGNLYGNTFDALISRLRGKPASGSSLWNELGVLLGVIVLIPYILLSQLMQYLIPK